MARIGAPSLTQSNREDQIYLCGSERVDGSIRFVFTPGEKTGHIELLRDGVYNDTGFRFSPRSIDIGRDLSLSAAAGFLETSNPSGVIGHIISLIPHVQFSDAGTGQPQTPILNKEQVFDVFKDAVSEIVAPVIGINLGVSPGRVLEESIHEVGSVGSTVPITVSFFIGSDNTGVLIAQRVLPANFLEVETTIEIDYENELGFLAGQPIFMEFSSSENISLKTDVDGNALTMHEAHELSTLELVTNNIMRNIDGYAMLNVDNEVMYARQFR